MTSYVDLAKNFNTQFELNSGEKIIVDFFAGGGGASTGLEIGLNRPVYVAVNHNPKALSMHQVNHPHAKHYVNDVFDVDLVVICDGYRVGWFHASPDCTHHSQAAGGQPRKQEIRDLSWVVSKFAGKMKPDVITLENVEQILQWGPLIAKRDKATGRVVTLDKIEIDGKIVYRVAEPGEVVPRHNQYLIPDPKRKGKSWKKFVKQLRKLGYVVEWQKRFVAANYGAPTKRSRLFLIARNDGKPIVWPEQTHFKPSLQASNNKKWKTTAQIIDFNDLGKSIFDRPKPLADSTLGRIARGIKKYIIEAKKPFFINSISSFVTEFANSSQQRNWPIDEPLSTICAKVKGGHHGLVSAELSQDNVKGALRVAAFLINYYGNGDARDINEPLDTLTTKDRLALVTVWIRDEPWLIVDIRLRMLKPRELYRAQGFPDSYIIEHGHDGKPLSKKDQVFMVGNSVSPYPMAAIARANNPFVQDGAI